jgi:hypothetical protein
MQVHKADEQVILFTLGCRPSLAIKMPLSYDSAHESTARLPLV